MVEGVMVPIRHIQLWVSVSGEGKNEHKYYQHQQEANEELFYLLSTEHKTGARAAP